MAYTLFCQKLYFAHYLLFIHQLYTALRRPLFAHHADERSDGINGSGVDVQCGKP